MVLIARHRIYNNLIGRVLEELNAEIRKHIGILFKITDCIGTRVFPNSGC